jgi:hypothetical protein
LGTVEREPVVLLAIPFRYLYKVNWPAIFLIKS